MVLESFKFDKVEDYDTLLKLYLSEKDKDKEAVEIINQYNGIEEEVPGLLKNLLNPATELIGLKFRRQVN